MKGVFVRYKRATWSYSVSSSFAHSLYNVIVVIAAGYLGESADLNFNLGDNLSAYLGWKAKGREE